MDFRHPCSLFTVWLCVLKKTIYFYHNFGGFGGILKIHHFLGQTTLIVTTTVSKKEEKLKATLKVFKTVCSKFV
jgi:hypothetical protein